MLVAIGVLVGALLIGIGLTLATWSLRPNRAEVDSRIVLETHDLVKDSLHNSNTYFVKLGERYLLAPRSLDRRVEL